MIDQAGPPARPAPPGLRLVPSPAGDVTPAPDDLCLVVAGRKLLVVDGERWRLPRLGELPGLAELPGLGPLVPLGTLDGVPAWAATAPESSPATGAGWHGWSSVAARLDEAHATLAGYALQVATFRATHRYCGQCATEMIDVPGETARRCAECGLYSPVRFSPAVLVAVCRPAHTPGSPGELLLVRHAQGPRGLWALVAGFLAPGESLEDCARREVWEEVGLELAEVTYFGSQPWALSGPGVVLVGFTALAADHAAEPVVDGHELVEARWFPTDALPADLPPAYSLSRWLVDAVTEGERGPLGMTWVGEPRHQASPPHQPR